MKPQLCISKRFFCGLSMALLLSLVATGSAVAQISDVSDAVFSIVVPSAAVQDVDMGTVVVGTNRDTLLQGFCRNTGPVPIRIDSMYLEGAQSADFAIISGRPPVSIARGAAQAVGFSFSPRNAGFRSATIVVITQVDAQRCTIRGVGIEPQIALEAGMIDFGIVPVGGRRDSTLDVMVRNLSAAPITVLTVEAGGPDLDQFSVLAGSAPFTMPPLGAQAMTLRFAPRRGGRTSGSLIFGVENSIQRPVAQLFGEGRSVQASATISVGTLAARAGDVVSIPLRLTGQENLLLSGATTLYTELSFDASLLVPAGATPKGSIKDGTRTIPLDNLPLLAGADSVIAAFDFSVTLGTSAETSLDLHNSVARGGDVALTEVPGRFRLLDLCEEGGTRLFSAQGQFRILPNQPNPFNSETILRFEIIENVHTRVDVFDMSGRLVATPFEGMLNAGSHVLPFNAGGLPTGMYSLQLRSGALVARSFLHVLK